MKNKKRLTIRLLLVFMWLPIGSLFAADPDTWDGSTVSSSLAGTGTSDDPYLIQSCEDWAYFAVHPRLSEDGVYYELTVDLDFEDQEMPCIGAVGSYGSNTATRAFKGNFDGNGNKIYNINARNPAPGATGNGEGAGLFGRIEGDVVIANLGVEGGLLYSNHYRGGFIGNAAPCQSLLVINCYNKANIYTQSGEQGGIVGYGNSNVCIVNCFAGGTFTQGGTRGGLIGVGGNATGYSSYSFTNERRLAASNFSSTNCYYDDGTGYGGGYDMKSWAFAAKLNEGQDTVWVHDVDETKNGGYPYLNEITGRITKTGEILGANIVTIDSDPFFMFMYGNEPFQFRIEQKDPDAEGRDIEILLNGVKMTADLDGVYTVPGNVSVAALEFSGYFARDNYNVIKKIGPNGSILGEESPAFGTTEIYTIQPDADYLVHTVFLNDSPVSVDENNEFSIFIEDDNIIVATFIHEDEVDVWDDNATPTTALEGDGTAANPYQIKSCADWVFLASQPDLYTGMNEFILMKHLDFAGNETPVVGNSSNSFIGFFNGNNKTFMNVRFSTNSNGSGLFGSISGNAVNKYNSMVCNIGVVSGTNNGSNGNLGAIVGRIGGSASTEFLNSSTYVFTGSIMNCYNHANIRIGANGNGGGIVGRNELPNNLLYANVMLANCYNRGEAPNGIGGEVNSRYPYYSVYNSGTITLAPSDPKNGQLVRIYNAQGGFGLLNGYYDSKYAAEGIGTAYATAKTTDEICSPDMVDLLNAAPSAPYYNQKEWVIDPAGIINTGKPYLNEAYRVYSDTPGLTFAPAGGYSPFLTYKDDDYKFRLTSATDGSVFVNGESVTLDADGYYTVTNVSGKLVITTDGTVTITDDIDLWDGKTATEITSGDGSSENPWQISSAAEFIWAVQNAAGTESMILTKDIDFNGYWSPIFGNSSAFNGTFDGNGHTLYNFRAAKGWHSVVTDNVGLFGALGGSGILKNLYMESAYIYGRTRVGLVGSNSGTIDHCGFNGVIQADQTAGGFIGHSGGTISNSYSIGKVIAGATASAGAILGDGNNNGGTFKNSYTVNNYSNSAGERSTGTFTNVFVMGTGNDYNKTEAELKAQATVDALNTDQGKVWTINEKNGGFPTFNDIFPVTFQDITNGTFEPVDPYTDIVYKDDAYKFILTPADDYTAQNVVVSINGTEATPNSNGEYEVTNAQQALNITYTGEIVAKTYTLLATAPTFDAVTYGYTQPEAKAITITSTGNSDATIVSALLSGDDASSFTIVDDEAIQTVISGATNTTYKVQPNGSLVVKTYTAIITVTYDNSDVATTEVIFTVNKADQPTLAVESVEDKTYGDVPFDLSTTGGGGFGTVTYELVSGPATVTAEGEVTITGAGTIVVKASKDGDDNYNGPITSAERSITVNKASQPTLTINSIEPKTFGDADFSLSTTGGNGDGAVTYTLVSGNATVTDDGIVTITGAGNIVVKATKADDGNFFATTSENLIITVNKADQPTTLLVSDVEPKTFGDTAFDLSASGGDGTGAITYVLVSGNATVTVEGNVTITGAGDIVVKAIKAGDDNYNEAESAELTIIVNKANQTTALVINDVAAKTYGDAAFDLSATGGDGTGAITYALVSGNATVTSAGNVTITGTGDIIVEALKAGDDNYNGPATSAELTITVNKAVLAATYEGETIQEGNDPVLEVKVTGFAYEETEVKAAGYIAPFIINTNTSEGTYTLTPEGGSADNYTFTYVSGELVIGKATGLNNPAMKNVLITTNQNGIVVYTPSVSNITVYSIHGIMVAMRQGVSGEVEIPVSNSFTGIVQVESGKDVITRKVVK